MIKSELIEKLAAENTHLTHAEVERVVNIVLGRMVEALGEGGAGRETGAVVAGAGVWRSAARGTGGATGMATASGASA